MAYSLWIKYTRYLVKVDSGIVGGGGITGEEWEVATRVWVHVGYGRGE